MLQAAHDPLLPLSVAGSAPVTPAEPSRQQRGRKAPLRGARGRRILPPFTMPRR